MKKKKPSIAVERRRARYARAGTINPRHIFSWSRIEGFGAWFVEVAPAKTNLELADAIQARWGEQATRASIDSLRRQYVAHMTPETRRRAYNARTNDTVTTPLSEDERNLNEVKRANVKLMRQLEEQRITKKELVDAVREAARDAAESMVIPPVQAPKLAKKTGTSETAIIHLTDWQLAKTTPTYSTDVCRERIARYVDKVIRLTQLQRADHPVRTAKVFLTGDLIEGEMIFPGQAHRIDASLYRQVMVDGPEILGDAIRRLASHFETVEVDGVIGNHGAIGGPVRRDYHPETNADAMMYEVTRLILKDEKRVTWTSNMVAGERKWYAVNYVGKKGFLLFHGDQVKGGFAGFPFYGFSKKILGWANGAIPEKFHYALAGHFHTPTRMTIGRTVVWVGGSTESDNTYAAEMLAAQGTPSQWLLFAHPEHGVTCEYQVHLEKGAYS